MPFSWGRRKRRESELDDEIRSHLQMAARDRVERGETHEGARLSARNEFGNVGIVKEVTRSSWGGNPFESISKDVAYAFRMIGRNRAFSAITIVVLALGIGANTAIFSVVDRVLLQPLPFPHAERLVRLYESSGTRGGEGPISYPTFLDWRRWNRSFKAIAAFTGTTALLTGSGEPARLDGVVASANLFELLGVQPILGRAFRPDEDSPHANQGADSIILGNTFWRTRFGGDPAILSRRLIIDSQPYIVVGVMPPGFDSFTGSRNPDFWITAAPITERSPNSPRPVSEERFMQFLGAVARLKPNVSTASAQTDMDRVSQALVSAVPELRKFEGVTIVDFQKSLTGDDRPVLLLLLGAAGLVLLIACADISGLVLARVTRRQREMTIRAAIGAGRWRTTRQLLVESFILAMSGGIAGFWLATQTEALLRRLLGVTSAQDSILDLRTLCFTFLAVSIAAVFFSLAPALHAARLDLMHGLREAALSVSESVRQRRLHAVMIAGQIALAMVLLTGAGLLTLSLIRLRQVPLGFSPEHVLTFSINLQDRYKTNERARVFEDILGRLRRLPGVQGAAAGMHLPIVGGQSNTVLDSVAGKPIPLEERRGIAYSPITPGYFKTLGIPVVRGREFNDDDRAGSLPVVIINQAAVRRYFGNQDALGQRIEPEMWNGSGSTTQPRTIVGIIADTKQFTLRGATRPFVYWPTAQIPCSSYTLVAVRTAGEVPGILNGIRARLQEVDRDLPLLDVQVLTASIAGQLAGPSHQTSLVAMFAVLAVLLTAIGLYGVIAYSVVQRTREIGIRMALGAGRTDVLRDFVRRGLLLSVIGVTIGGAGAMGSVRLIRSLLFGVSTTQVGILIAAAAVLILVSLAASYLPARRASRIDPMLALRYD